LKPQNKRNRRKELAEKENIEKQKNREVLQKIKNYLCPDLTAIEFEVFMRRLKALENFTGIKIDPWAKEIIPIVYKKNDPQKRTVAYIWTVGLRLRVLQSIPGYIRHRSCAVFENDKFRMTAKADEPDHDWGAKDRGKILGAWAAVYLEGGKNFFKYLPFDEMKKTPSPGDGETDLFWKKMQSHMAEKTILSTVCREVTPELAAHSYTEEEAEIALEIEKEALREAKTPALEAAKQSLFNDMLAHFEVPEKMKAWMEVVTNGKYDSIENLTSREEIGEIFQKFTEIRDGQ
jgi:recombinational DNA repair protein RecT